MYLHNEETSAQLEKLVAFKTETLFFITQESIKKKLDLTEVLHEKRFTQILVAHLTAGSYNTFHHHTLQVKCRRERRAGKRNV